MLVRRRVGVESDGRLTGGVPRRLVTCRVGIKWSPASGRCATLSPDPEWLIDRRFARSDLFHGRQHFGRIETEFVKAHVQQAEIGWWWLDFSQRAIAEKLFQP